MGGGNREGINLRELIILERFIKNNCAPLNDEEDDYKTQEYIISLVDKGYLQQSSAASGAEYQVTDYGKQEYENFVEKSKDLVSLASDALFDSVEVVNSYRRSAAIVYSNLIKNLQPQIAEIGKIANQYGGLSQKYAQQISDSLAPVSDIVARSMQNVGFDADVYKSLMQNIRSSVIDVSKSLRTQLRGWEEAISDIEFDDVITLIATEGIPLIGACPPKISSRIVKASSQHERERIIIQSDVQILEFCSQLAHLSGGEDGKFLSKAIEMYQKGEYIPSQAVAAIALDPLFHRHAELLVKNDSEMFRGLKAAKRYISVSEDRWNSAKDPYPQKVQERFEDRSLTTALILALFMSTHKFYDFGESSVPSVFNRHATVHSGNIKHFTQINALKGIMSVSCALWGFHKYYASYIEESMS